MDLLTPNRSTLTSIIIPCFILPDKDAELLDFLRRCIDSIRKYTTNYELILVDNGSPIGVEYMVEQADVYIHNGHNLGFAKAVNQGLNSACDEWIVVMNNDIQVIDGWLDTMQQAFMEHPKTGVVSSHLHDADPHHRAHGYIDVPAGHMFGALWLTHADVVDQVGLLDEEYGLGYYEDKDYWMRLLEAGYVLSKAGWCYHIGNATSGKLPGLRKFFFENKARFEARWGEDAL